MTAIVSNETLERVQDHSSVFGAGSEVKTNTTLNRASYFRGGKGGGFTTEFQVEAVSGEVETEVEGAQANQSEDTSSTLMLTYAMGFSKGFGLSISVGNYIRDYSQVLDQSGTDYEFTEETNAIFTSIKPGFIWGDNLRLGFFLDLIMQSGNVKSSSVSSDNTYNENTDDQLQGMFPIGGLALGMIGSSFQFEVGYEAPLITEDPSGGDETPEGEKGLDEPTPTRLSFLIETKLGGLTLGYKFAQYTGRFTEIQNLLPSQLLYPNAGNEPRVEHIINFSLGASKGFSFGVSGFISETETEESSVLIANSEEKLPSTSKAQGVSIRVGYVF